MKFLFAEYIKLFKFCSLKAAPTEIPGGRLIVNYIMADANLKEGLENSQLKLHHTELPDCLSCKVIGAGACFGSSAYLLLKRNTLGHTPTAKSAIGIVAAGTCTHAVLAFSSFLMEINV